MFKKKEELEEEIIKQNAEILSRLDKMQETLKKAETNIFYINLRVQKLLNN